MEPKNALQGFTGRLDNVQLLDVIQMACLAQKDGQLLIKGDLWEGMIVLERGRILHAEAPGKSGETALLEILCWPAGRFVFTPNVPDRKIVPTIQGGWEQVLMEAVPRLIGGQFEPHAGRRLNAREAAPIKGKSRLLTKIW